MKRQGRKKMEKRKMKTNTFSTSDFSSPQKETQDTQEVLDSCFLALYSMYTVNRISTPMTIWLQPGPPSQGHLPRAQVAAAHNTEQHKCRARQPHWDGPASTSATTPLPVVVSFTRGRGAPRHSYFCLPGQNANSEKRLFLKG